jgi:lipopolysaccharide export system protein LptA
MPQESAYCPELDNSIKGAELTLDMNTERLAQFPDDYEMLKHIEDESQRIIMK